MKSPQYGGIWIFCQGKEFKTKKNKEAAGKVYKNPADEPERPAGSDFGYIGFLQFGIII